MIPVLLAALLAGDTIFANGFEAPCGGPPFPVVQQLVPVKYGTKGSAIVSSADQAFRASPTDPVLPFPWHGNRAITMAVSTSQYVALPFLAPSNLSPTFAARIGFFDTNYMVTPVFPLAASYSVSICPGDFTGAQACRAQWNNADGDYITLGPGVCTLVPGAKYYINVVTASLLALPIPQCAGANCAVSLSYSELQP